MTADLTLFESLQLMMPELSLCLAAIILLVVGAIYKEKALDWVLMLALAAIVLSFGFVLQFPHVNVLVFKEMFLLNGFTTYAKMLILGAAMLTLVLSVDWVRSVTQRRFEYPVLMLLSVFGLMLLVSANDFLSLYMALELGSLALYVMAAFDRDDAFASEAGLKYFILGALASGMLLFGVSLLYGFTGTTNFTLLANLFAGENYAMTAGVGLGLVLIMVGLCFKVSTVPFHMWTPDVYEGAPTPVVTFFAVAPKVAALVLLARLLEEPFAALQTHWQPILQVVAVGSMLIGAFGALSQTNIKRLLAYSSIGHVGYALVGVLVGNEVGMQAMMIYLSLYLFMSLGAFGAVIHMRRDGQPVLLLNDMAGVSKSNPMFALFMALMMFSMAGIPPLAGFFGKFYVFKAALESGLYGLVVIGLLASVVSAYYYLKIVKIMYFDEGAEPLDSPVPVHTKAVLAVCALVTGFFFLSPTSLLEMTGKAVGLM
jgi:NADH-quinone oxidoreductase subunit N